MKCPNCGSEHPPEAGRFCEACGLSVRGTTRETGEPEGEEAPDRCPACGAKARPPVCSACYTRIPGEIED
jgi:hypothetical protein